MAPDKRSLLNALVARLDDEIARATTLANRTREDATHPEARAENDKDTRALEQTYLARGQALRVVDLEEAAKRLRFMDLRTFGKHDAVDLSALVRVEPEDGSESEARWYFLVPAGGGSEIVLDGVTIGVLSTDAPLARALLGRQSGDDVELRVAGKQRSLVITDVV